MLSPVGPFDNLLVRAAQHDEPGDQHAQRQHGQAGRQPGAARLHGEPHAVGGQQIDRHGAADQKAAGKVKSPRHRIPAWERRPAERRFAAESRRTRRGNRGSSPPKYLCPPGPACRQRSARSPGRTRRPSAAATPGAHRMLRSRLGLPAAARPRAVRRRPIAARQNVTCHRRLQKKGRPCEPMPVGLSFPTRLTSVAVPSASGNCRVTAGQKRPGRSGASSIGRAND